MEDEEEGRRRGGGASAFCTVFCAVLLVKSPAFSTRWLSFSVCAWSRMAHAVFRKLSMDGPVQARTRS